MRIIKRINSEATIYPDVKAYNVTVLYEDNKEHELILPKAEVDLELYIKQLSNKLTEKEVKHLKSLIDAFGQDQYEKGDFNANYDG